MQQEPRARARRWVLRVAIAAAGVAILYLVGFNLVLSTGLFKKLLNQDPETVRIGYRSAWSFFPGTVHAKDLSVRSQDTGVQWEVRLDDAKLRVNLFALFHREFHATSVRGAGLTVYARQKIAPEQVDETLPDHVAMLPPIDGFDRIPLRTEVPAPVTDENYNLWTARLDGIDVTHVREVWIDSAHYTGESSLTGRFCYQPLRFLEVGPVQIAIERGDFSLGMKPVAENVTGTIAGQLDGFDPRGKLLGSIRNLVTTDLAIDGSIRAIEPFNQVVQGVRFDKGAGTIHAAVRVEKGQVLPASIVNYATKSLRVQSDDKWFDGSLKLEAKTRETKPEDKAEQSIDLVANTLGAVHAGRDESFSGHSGQTKTDAQITITRRDTGPSSAHGEIVFTASEMQIRSPKFVLVGAAAGKTQIRRFDIEDGTIDLSGSYAEVSRVAVVPRSDKAAAIPAGARGRWWARMDLVDASARVSPPSLQTGLAIAATDASPLIYILTHDSPLPEWAANVISTKALRATGRMKMSAGFVEFANVRATTEGADARAWFRRRASHSTEGAALLKAGPLSVGLEIAQGGVKPILLDADDWFQRHVESRDATQPPGAAKPKNTAKSPTPNADRAPNR